SNCSGTTLGATLTSTGFLAPTALRAMTCGPVAPTVLTVAKARAPISETGNERHTSGNESPSVPTCSPSAMEVRPATSHPVRSFRNGCGENPEGIPTQSPGLRGTSYPGFAVAWESNPERVVPA